MRLFRTEAEELPRTLEAGIVRVADALDMTSGRSRIPFESGDTGIYSVSESAINGVKIEEGNEKPLSIVIELNNSAGVFHVNGLLKDKIRGSGLEKYIQVRAYINQKKERKLIKEFVIDL
jgi:uncharacterized protein